MTVDAETVSWQEVCVMVDVVCVELINPFCSRAFFICGNRMGYTGWLASQSDLMFMTYKGVHIEGMDVDFCFHKQNIQICNDFVTDGRVEY